MHKIKQENQPLLPPGETITTASSRHRTYTIEVISEEEPSLEALRAKLDGHPVVIVTDHTVAARHGRRIASWLSAQGVPQTLVSFAPGERSKSLQTACYLLDELAKGQFSRRDILIALGGGVVIDTAGWVASSYMRGIPYINMPTTLLAQIDAAIGGKVAVDHAKAKNLIGAFYEPQAVVSCVGYLSTLEPRHVRAGLAEAVKVAVIASPELFSYIELNLHSMLALDPPSLRRLVHGASVIKCRLVEVDPYEADLGRALNFGHAVGHAVETAAEYEAVLHGEAVSLGMAVEVGIAVTRGLLNAATAARIIHVLAAAGLPVTLDRLRSQPSLEKVIAGLAKIRQIRDGSLRFVLPADIGSVLIADDVNEDEVRAALSDPIQDRVAVGSPGRARARSATATHRCR